MDVTYSSSISPRLISGLFFGKTTTTTTTTTTQQHILWILYDSAVYRAPFCWIRGLPSAGDGLWPLCGCLRAMHYLVVMRQRVHVVLPVVSWVGGFLHSVIKLGTVYGLPFRGPNVTDHYTCNMYPLLKLVCTDTHVTGLLVASSGGLICAIVFLLLLISYGVILHSLKNLSQEGRRKALQTCGSHIAAVVCFFVPSIFM